MKTITAGTIKRLHVNKHVIASNRKNGRNEPAITVQTSSGPLRAHKVHVRGPSTFIYRPEKPLSCGAVLWIETRAAVTLD